MKKVAVLQSNYIPWKGYFDIINDVDLFIFYDDVQYTKNDWRNRNKIKVENETKWLTIPVGAKKQLINEVTLEDRSWQKKHWNSLSQHYSKSPYFSLYSELLKEIYLDNEWESLSDLNQFIIRKISVMLGIKVKFMDSKEVNNIEGKKLDRLINLLKAVETDEYISGPAAKDYISEEKFKEAGIKLTYKDYQDYPEYTQFDFPCTHNVTILDLLFHTGVEAPYYIWGWRNENNK
ncbi:WbqC family protein [Lysinibacillus sp. UGB7]|uniref:WbqC family protein n=1 Tax=Lysinibacillus sp. UGB7 TaxID=3411039 RepID=UPI003B79FC16